MSERAEYTAEMLSIHVISRLWCSGNTSASQGYVMSIH